VDRRPWCIGSDLSLKSLCTCPINGLTHYPSSAQDLCKVKWHSCYIMHRTKCQSYHFTCNLTPQHKSAASHLNDSD